MAHLYLVKGNKKQQDAPRRGRAPIAATERRYRYPSEEIWEVSDDHWQTPLPQEREACSLPARNSEPSTR